LPPLLWSTSALCPVLILPATSAEAVARGGAVRLMPAIRMPSLPAWEQAVALIVRRNQQARRHRRDYPQLPGAPSRTVSLSAALRLAETLGDVARAVRGKDPVRRENPGTTQPEPGTSPPTAHATARFQDPMRRESAARLSLPVTLADPSGDRAPSIPPAATTIAAHAKDPMHREKEASLPRSGPLRNGNPRGNPNLAPRCGARTRQGCPCRGPAMRNGRCRMHGGKSTGPRTVEGLARLRAAARARHGGEAAADARAFARSCRVLISETRALLALAEMPAGNRPAVSPEALFDALLPRPLLGLPTGMLFGRSQPPDQQTIGRSPCTVRIALPEPPIGHVDQATAGLGFASLAPLSPLPPLRQDPVRRERQPLRQPLAARVVLPALAPTAGPPAGVRAARQHSHRLDSIRKAHAP